MKRSVFVPVVVMLASATLLTGCGAFYTEKVAGMPSEVARFYSEKTLGMPSESPEAEVDIQDPHPMLVWAEGGEDWLLATWGSSSCPNAPVSLESTAPGEFTIELEHEGGPVCTADLGPTTFRLSAPEGVSPADSLIVDVGPGTRIELGPAE